MKLGIVVDDKATCFLCQWSDVKAGREERFLKHLLQMHDRYMVSTQEMTGKSGSRRIEYYGVRWPNEMR